MDIDLDSKKGRELALADNASAKANINWDFEAINYDWNETEIKDWGLDVPIFTIDDSIEIKDNTKGAVTCPNCGVTL